MTTPRRHERRDDEPDREGAAERVERLEPRLAEARTELHAAIRQAHAEGARPATIARMAGLSRERIRQILSAS